MHATDEAALQSMTHLLHLDHETSEQRKGYSSAPPSANLLLDQWQIASTAAQRTMPSGCVQASCEVLDCKEAEAAHRPVVGDLQSELAKAVLVFEDVSGSKRLAPKKGFSLLSEAVPVLNIHTRALTPLRQALSQPQGLHRLQDNVRPPWSTSGLSCCQAKGSWLTALSNLPLIKSVRHFGILRSVLRDQRCSLCCESLNEAVRSKVGEHR